MGHHWLRLTIGGDDLRQRVHTIPTIFKKWDEIFNLHWHRHSGRQDLTSGGQKPSYDKFNVPYSHLGNGPVPTWQVLHGVHCNGRALSLGSQHSMTQFQQKVSKKNLQFKI